MSNVYVSTLDDSVAKINETSRVSCFCIRVDNYYNRLELLHGDATRGAVLRASNTKQIVILKVPIHFQM